MRLDSVIFWTDDMNRLLGFYRDRLGFEVDFESPDFVALRTDQGAQICVGKHSEVSGKTKEPYRVMANFAVDDCQAEFERLKERGVSFIREPSVDENDGVILATFQDPDGNTLQLMQFPPST
jgi:predicted enzyme related to lactoylglutathione lyase